MKKMHEEEEEEGKRDIQREDRILGEYNLSIDFLF